MKIRSKSPLRLGLAGGGTDVSPYSDMHGGMILNAAINKYCYCFIETAEDNKIEFSAHDIKETFQTESLVEIPLDGKLLLHKGVYNRMIKDFIKQPLSFRMVTYSDAPAGSGLGSSSSMVVAMIGAFVEWFDLPLGEYDIAHLAFEIERKDLRLSGGKQDQYAATFGGFNFMEFYDNDQVIINPLKIKNSVINEIENSLVLYYTGRSRESANIIDEQIRNVKNENEKSISAMHELKKDAIELKKHLLRGDIDNFIQVFHHSWEAKKKMAQGITNPHIEEVYDFAMKHGATAGKISGAGGGGFFMFFTNPINRYNLVQALSTLKGNVIDAQFEQDGVVSWKILT